MYQRSLVLRWMLLLPPPSKLLPPPLLPLPLLPLLHLPPLPWQQRPLHLVVVYSQAPKLEW
jgi:hypothetical protein